VVTVAQEINTPLSAGSTPAEAVAGRRASATSRRLAHVIDERGLGRTWSDSGPGSVAGLEPPADPTHGQPEATVAGAQTPRIHSRVPDGPLVESRAPATRRPALALTAEGPRRADLIAWASAHYSTLASMRLLAPATIAALLAEHVGLSAEPLPSGTVGPSATTGLAAAGEIDAMIAFTDPVEVRAGDTTTRSLTRLAVFWDIPMAGNRATADLLLAQLVAGRAEAIAPEITEDQPTEPVRGAVKLWNIRATLDDVPGRLAILAASLARRAINILAVQVYLTPDGPVDELLVAASPLLTVADLAAAVVDGGARAPRVTPADAHALVDGPTRALSLAARLLRNPDDLPAVLTSLFPGAEVTWRPEPPAGLVNDATDLARGGDVTKPGSPVPAAAQLWLNDPSGGGYLLSRPAAPFTPAERARAYAMVDIAVEAQVRPEAEPAPESWQLVLPTGVAVTVRVATPEDLDAVVAMHHRCSMTSRLRRYLSSTRTPSTPTLARLLSPASGYSLVVEDYAGSVVALGSLIWPSGTGPSDAPELAILVEDAWQRRRLGTFLARRLLAHAAQLGVGRVRTVVHASNTAMVRIMSQLCEEPGHRLHREYDGGLLTLIVSLRSETPVG
jgi:methylglyoxal synthase/RimJ/RimL family protein N-acetyltransferase